MAYTNGIRLLAGAAEGFTNTQVRFRRRVFTEFKRPEKTIEVWLGLEPLEPDRLSAEDAREAYRVERILREQRGAELSLENRPEGQGPESRRMRATLRDERRQVRGSIRRQARYPFRVPIDVAAVEAGILDKIVGPAQEVATAEFERVARATVAQAAQRAARKTAQ